VKTAISLPDDTFDRASRRAAELGMSRSEFFAVAAQRYLDELDDESTTRQIDVAIESFVQPDESSEDAVNAGHRMLDESDDEW
jgi:metal-responsive CopG/Arc/MetJ family transcriptional regulator